MGQLLDVEEMTALARGYQPFFGTRNTHGDMKLKSRKTPKRTNNDIGAFILATMME